MSRLNLGICSLLALVCLAFGCADNTASEKPSSEKQASAQNVVAKTAVEKSEKESTTVASNVPSLLTEAEISQGWISLFDGETLFGWKAHSDANWRVENGAITVDSGEPGLLCTTSSFDDYTLQVEFRAADATNSGIFLRTAPQVAKTDLTTKCYELNIAGSDNPFPTGSLVQRAKATKDCQDTGWQTLEARVIGDKINIKYNGEEVLEYQDPQPIGRGLIGLQLNSGKIEFRSIKLRPERLNLLFNGRTLEGWKEYPAMASKFTVTPEGKLHVVNGKGQLESQDQFGDFVLQLMCQTNAQNLNSGLFFRCIPGEQMNGYESQIHNGFKEGDRAKPLDCGTGGIFRRVDARRVVANDQEWFVKTLIADGPHVSVWVNGYQVTDWTDTRQPDPNPRKGLRLEPGTLMIQGHDPTTDILFDRIMARELAKR